MTAPIRGPLSGEILTGADVVQVVAAMSPLSLEAMRFAVPAGLSIAEIVALAEAKRDCRLGRLAVAIDGWPILPEHWRKVRVKPGRTVTLRAVPSGSSSGLLRSLLLVAVAIAAIVIAPYAAPLIAGLGVSTAVATSLAAGFIATAGTMLINALFPTAKANADNSTAAQRYSIAGNANAADPYGPIPVILGRHRVSPRPAAQPITEITGSDQYLRQLFVVGIGTYAVSSLKLGDTSISDYEDVQVEILQCWAGGPQPTLYPKLGSETSLELKLIYGDTPAIRTTPPGTTEILVDVTAPAGAFHIGAKDGARASYYVQVQAQYRLSGSSGGWTTFAQIDFQSTDETPIRLGGHVALDAGTYDVRCLRTTQAFADAYPGSKDSSSDDVYWTAFRSFRPGQVIATDVPVTVIAMRIRGSQQLSGVVADLTCIADSGTANPGYHGLTVLQGPGNRRPKTDDEIDLAAWAGFAAWCDANGYRGNLILDSQRSIPETLQLIAACGRGLSIKIDGRWSVVWDDPDDGIVQFFDPGNSRNFALHRDFVRLPHAFRIAFKNEDNDWQDDERIVYADGYDATNATRFDQIELPGLTNADLVWRFGRYHLAQLLLRPETASLDVDIQSLACFPGCRVRINHDVPKWGLGFGRVRGAGVDGSDDRAILDNPVLLESGTDYVIRFWRADSSEVLRTVLVEADGETASLKLAGHGDLPEYGDAFAFGYIDEESVVMRVKRIDAGEDFAATLTLTDDAPDIALADQGAIPPFDTHILAAADPSLAMPVSLRLHETLASAGIGQTIRALFSWQAGGIIGQAIAGFEIEARPPGGRWTPYATTTALHYDFGPLPAGNWGFRVRTRFASGAYSRYASLYPVYLDGNDDVPEDVDDFRISILGAVATLTWTRPTLSVVDHFEIRQSGLAVGASWGASNPIAEHVTGTSVQVPALSGTYLIKAIGPNGGESRNAKLIEVGGAGLDNVNIVETRMEAVPFSGEKDGVYYNGGHGGLMLPSGPPFYGTHGGDSFYGANPDRSFYPHSPDDIFPPEGIYFFSEVVDLGDSFTSRVSSTLDAFGTAINSTFYGTPGSFYADRRASFYGVDKGEWSAVLEISTTPDDPGGSPVWSDWAQLIVGDYTARGDRFRIRLVSATGRVSPVIVSASVTIDMPDRTEGDNDLTCPAGGLRVTFPRGAFRSPLPAVTPIAQDLSTGDRMLVSDKDASGFQIEFFNSAGTSIARTFDYIARGYGTVVN